MYCNKCGKEIPENSKFCNECGSPIIEKNEQQIVVASEQPNDARAKLLNSVEQPTTSAETTKTTESNNDAPKPKLSNAFWICGIILFLGFLYLRAMISSFTDAFELGVLLVILIIAVCAFVCFGTMYVFISDYRLSKIDFEQYKAKVEKQKKFEEGLKELQEMRERDEQKKKDELSAKRAEYRSKGIPSCPKCGSPSIATINRGYSMVSGFIGSGKPVNVCQMCGYKWQIGK